MDYLNFFVTAFVALFVIVDPLGTTGVFLALTSKLKESETRKIAIKACTIASLLLIIFGLCGLWLLEILHISPAAFRITGGLLLFVTAFRMVMGYHDPDQLNEEDNVYKDRSSIAVFPLAIPLLAGPGCMTTALLLMTQDPYLFSINKLIVILTILLVQGITLVSWFGSKKIIKYLGETGSLILARVMGILLAAMSVQFVVDGIIELFKLS